VATDLSHPSDFLFTRSKSLPTPRTASNWAMPHKVYVVEEIPAHPVNKMLAPQHVEVVGAGGKPLPAAYRFVPALKSVD
jgi:hypothetical protein